MLDGHRDGSHAGFQQARCDLHPRVAQCARFERERLRALLWRHVLRHGTDLL